MESQPNEPHGDTYDVVGINGSPNVDIGAPRDIDSANVDIGAPRDTPKSDGPKTLGGFLSRERMQAHAKVARPLERVALPWLGEGTHIFVRGLSATGKDRFDDQVFAVKRGGELTVKVEGVRALLISLCACDAEGERVFTDKDVPMLETLDGKTADAIYVVAARLSNLTNKDVQEMVKN
jgi:hypothetical protein